MKTNNKQSSVLSRHIDTHILIGRDRSGKYGTIDNYMQKTEGKYGVVGAMSIVSPSYQRESGRYFPCIWKDTRSGILTRSELRKQDGSIIYGKTPDNPYKEATQITRNELVGSASKYPDTQFLHFPLLHLTRDTLEYLEQVLSSNRVVKVHGIGSALGPEDIPEEVGRLMGKYENIVLPHTDYFQGEPKTALQDLQKRNDPIRWMDFLEKYSVKGMLAHGARLCKETLRRVEKNEGQFIVEAGPRINSKGTRVKTRSNDYVGKLIEMVGINQLVFNTDYPFMEEGEDLDSELSSRLSNEDYQKVMYENAQRFLRLNDGKYLRGNKI